MGTSNREAVQKAVVTAADTLASAGALNTEQAKQFLDFVVDETTLQEHLRVVRFTPQSMEINKIGVGARVAVPYSEARDPAVRAGVTTSKITLTPVGIMVPFEISKDFLQYNVEEDDAEEHVIRMMARSVANNLEELYIDGQADGPAVNPGNLPGGIPDANREVQDTYLALMDGFPRRAYDSGHQVDFEHAEIGTELSLEMLASMPTKFKKRKNSLRLFYASEMDERLRHRIGERATAAGDSAMFGPEKPIIIMGVPHISVPLLDRRPTWCEHVAMNGLGAHSLEMERVEAATLVGHPAALARVPTASFVEGVGNDFTLVAAAGTVARLAGGNIGDGDNVKWTYTTPPMAWMTVVRNMILAIGTDISIEKDYNIYGRVHEYAIHAKVDIAFEEDDAVVHARHILDPAA